LILRTLKGQTKKSSRDSATEELAANKGTALHDLSLQEMDEPTVKAQTKL
jgi:hypothetical protein